ncbi:MAG: hypothetical protein KF833_18540 [Verrucomicrobiae bacterium]|nr:hypothetical protein [Verrucomicrobiae bacterium]
MFADAELNALYVRVLDRMVATGWIHRYTFTEGKGFHITWTLPVGVQRARGLKQIIQAFGLDADDRGLLALSILSRRLRLPEGWVLEADCRDLTDPALLDLVNHLFEELGIHDDEDGLLVLGMIVTGWAPDRDTQIILGPPRRGS